MNIQSIKSYLMAQIMPEKKVPVEPPKSGLLKTGTNMIYDVIVLMQTSPQLAGYVDPEKLMAMELALKALQSCIKLEEELKKETPTEKTKIEKIKQVLDDTRNVISQLRTTLNAVKYVSENTIPGIAQGTKLLGHLGTGTSVVSLLMNGVRA